jgi:hypothetical protein
LRPRMLLSSPVVTVPDGILGVELAWHVAGPYCYRYCYVEVTI